MTLEELVEISARWPKSLHSDLVLNVLLNEK